MRNIYIVLFTWLSSWCLAQNSLSVKDMTLRAESSGEISILMDNTDLVTAVQFNLYLPQGLSVNTDETKLTDRKKNHSLIIRNKGGNRYLVIVYSGTNATFKGNEGALIKIPIALDNSLRIGSQYDLRLTDVILSSPNGESIGTNHKNGILTISKEKVDLSVENLEVNKTQISPEESIEVSWQVKNKTEGKLERGWNQKVFLQNSSGTIQKELYSRDVIQELTKDVASNQNITLTLPKEVGISGDVKIRVEVKPLNETANPETITDNNVLISDVIQLSKKLYIRASNTSFKENSESNYTLTVVRSGETAQAETFTITSTGEGYIDIPTNITIPEGESSATVNYRAINNEVVQGTKDFEIKVKGNGYSEEGVNLHYIEDEEQSYTLTVADDYTSNPGDNILFTLNVGFVYAENQKFYLETNKSNRVQLPEFIELSAGEKTITFNATIINSQEIIKSEQANIIVKLNNREVARKVIELADSNIPQIEMSLTNYDISEAAGVNAGVGTLKRKSTDKVLKIKLKTDISGLLMLPENLTFEEGVNEISFNYGVIDNATVDGTRVVTLYPQVYAPNCNCYIPIQTDKAQKQINVEDNDNAKLNISVSSSTLKAGEKGELEISRNIKEPILLQEEVVVSISHNYESVLKIQNSVTIPAGETSVRVPFTTSIDTSLSGNQNIEIRAEANDFESAIAYLLVVDQNIADAIVYDLTVDTDLNGGQTARSVATIRNIGFNVLAKGARVNLYFGNTVNSRSQLLSEVVLPESINPNESLSVPINYQLPEKAGEFYLTAVVNKKKVIQELNYDNNSRSKVINLNPSYKVTLDVNKKQFLNGEVVVLSGRTLNLDDTPLANAPFDLKISVGSISRKYSLTTNDNGEFVYRFKPLQNESGYYLVTASYPEFQNSEYQEFEVLGINIVNKPNFIKWMPFYGEPKTYSLDLKNDTHTTLTGVNIQLPNDVPFELRQTPITLLPGEKKLFEFTVISNKVMPLNEFYTYPITIMSNEGAERIENIYYHSRKADAKLVINPKALNTTMTKGETRQIEVVLRNEGGMVAKNVVIDLPDLAWLQMDNVKNIGNLEPEQEVTLLFNLTPTETEEVNVPIVGSIAVNSDNSDGVKIPFRIETVSDNTGSLLVDATDEFTYNTTEKPHLAGAKVEVIHPFNGTVVAEGITGSDGLLNLENIKEGKYILKLSAEHHNPHQEVILIAPERETRVIAILPYKAITYDYTVERIEIEDRYKVKLITTFETNVPKPVVTIDIDNSEIDLEVGQQMMSTVKITNHGLVAAENGELNFESLTGYDISPLINSSIRFLAPGEMLEVPVLITRKDATIDCRPIKVTTRYMYRCGNEYLTLFSYNYYRFNKGCPENPYPSGDYGEGGGLIRDTSGFRNFGPGLPMSPTNKKVISDGEPVKISTPIDFCDPCLQLIMGFFPKISAIFDKVKLVGKVQDAIDGNPERLKDYVEDETKSFIYDLFDEGINTALGVVDQMVNAFACGFEIGSSIYPEHRRNQKLKNEDHRPSFYVETTEEVIGELDNQFVDLVTVRNTHTARKARLLYTFGEDLYYNTEKEKFFSIIEKFARTLEQEQKITVSELEDKKNELGYSSIVNLYIDDFANKWNASIDAWNQGILEPNDQYPDIINKNELNYLLGYEQKLKDRVKARHKASPYELFYDAVKGLEKEVSKKRSQNVCATITLEFEQRVTMTREAFKGTLKINNGSNNNISDIRFIPEIKNLEGENKNDLFQINPDEFLNGDGTVEPNNSGKGEIIFIPTKQAAPETPISYSFGGSFSYYDSVIDDRVTVELNPTILEVNPSPDLTLDYFLKRNILGDDPLTEDVVEQSVPAELALMIRNNGYGDAKNVQVESMRPKIIENKKHVPIKFDLVGGSINNEPIDLGYNLIDFGTVGAHSVKIGQWWVQSNILGHFIKNEVEVAHTTSFGNKNLSLISGANVHELIKSIDGDISSENDGLADFLVNDIPDDDDYPDHLYLSDGKVLDVFKPLSFGINEEVNVNNLQVKLNVEAGPDGWNYFNVDDPGNGIYELYKVIRDRDDYEIPEKNYWQTFVTLKDREDPLYENKIHFIDFIDQDETYSLFFRKKTAIDLRIEKMSHVPQGTNESIRNITVYFNTDIDQNSFNLVDVALYRNGEKVDLKHLVIDKIKGNEYVIMFQSLTDKRGSYRFLINTQGIKTTKGKTGKEIKIVEWTQFGDELGIIDFENSEEDQQSINRVKVIFNKPIIASTFTIEDLLLNGKHLTSSSTNRKHLNYSRMNSSFNKQRSSEVSIHKENDQVFYIDNLLPYNSNLGDYTLSVDVKNIEAQDNSSGLKSQSYKWIVENGQTIKNICKKAPYENGVSLQTKVGISTLNYENDNWIQNSRNGFIKMESATKPFVITRLTTEQRDKISNPIEGMIIWNITNQCLELFKDFGQGLEWACITQGCNK
ncbi:hypothetical protein KRX57_00485 [Weeksellaceae bacterium TAE3-ERU29]|nr:hypothetical protein [Weeksellaceae bacterium TAE3-ERU29]